MRSIKRGRQLVTGLAATALLSGGGATAALAMDDDVPPPVPNNLAVESIGRPDGTDVSFDGEAGSLVGISSSQNASISSTARNGNGGLRISSQTASGYVQWNSNVVPQGQNHAALRFWVRLESKADGESVDLFTLANNTGSRNFDFFVTSDTGRFKWDIHYSAAGESTFAVEYGRWYLIEARVDFSGTNHTAEVRIDGVDQGTLTSSGVDTTVASMKVGAYQSKTHTQIYDDLSLAVGTEPMQWLEAGGDSSNVVRWDAVVDGGGSGLRIYQIWRDGRWYDWVPAGTTEFVDVDPVVGARYQVRAEDAAGNKSSWSNSVDYQP